MGQLRGREDASKLKRPNTSAFLSVRTPLGHNCGKYFYARRHTHGIEKQCMHSMTFTHLHHVTGGQLQQHQRVFPVHALIIGVARHAQLPRCAALRRNLAEELRRSPYRQALQPSLGCTGIADMCVQPAATHKTHCTCQALPI